MPRTRRGGRGGARSDIHASTTFSLSRQSVRPSRAGKSEVKATRRARRPFGRPPFASPAESPAHHPIRAVRLRVGSFVREAIGPRSPPPAHGSARVSRGEAPRHRGTGGDRAAVARLARRPETPDRRDGAGGRGGPRRPSTEGRVGVRPRAGFGLGSARDASEGLGGSPRDARRARALAREASVRLGPPLAPPPSGRRPGSSDRADLTRVVPPRVPGRRFSSALRNARARPPLPIPRLTSA